MTTGTNHQHSDRAQQLERLSAYLDNELDETERALLEEHLSTCEECRNALDELSETRNLLRAVPALTLPRSFVIPETGAIPQPLAGARRTTPVTSTVQRHRSARMLQWVGGLVATLGLLIFIATTLPAIRHSPATSASSSQSSAAAPQYQSTDHPQTGPTPDHSLGGQQIPTQATLGTAVPTSGDHTPYGPLSPENAPPLGPIAGVLLLIGGAGLLLTGTLFFRRRALL